MIISVFGKKGTGKTTYAGKLIAGRDKSKHCVIIDLFDQFPLYPLIDIDSFYHYAMTSFPSNPVRLAIFDLVDFGNVSKVIGVRRDILLVVDEIDFFDSATKQVLDFKRLIHYSRHYRVDLITTSRRPANVSRDLTSQTDEFIIFSMTERRDLEYFRNLSEDLPDRIKGLKKYEFLKFP